MVPTYIELEGAINARHLGGYAGSLGVTTEDAFIRMDAPTRLTAKDITLLLDRGVETVIDLRGEEEFVQDLNPFCNMGEVDFHHISMLQTELSPHMIGNGNLEDLYCHMISDCHDTIADVMRKIIHAEGVVLFHCTAGKDRTGVIAALLLSLVGVPEKIVVREYTYTEILLSKWREVILSQAQKQGLMLDEALLEAKPEFIRKALNLMHGRYGNTESYMKHIGLSNNEIETLKQRLYRSM